ncbi:MAG: FHA domain-containing protein [Lentisphaerae bacterium]|nr:FHA domain-containing protein [Lentisphaerota bacterium]
MYRVAFIDGPLKGRKLTVHEDRLCIGRDADCSLRMSDPSIAGHHAEIEVRDGVVHVRRAAPDAALAVGGVPVGDVPVPLRRGEVLGLGPHTLRVETGPAPVALPSRLVVNLSVIAVVTVAALLAIQGALLVRAFALGREVRTMRVATTNDPAGALPATNAVADAPRTHLLRYPPPSTLEPVTAPTNATEGATP